MGIQQEVSREILAKHALAEQQLRRTFLEQHRATKDALERKLNLERARADQAERLAAQSLGVEKPLDKIAMEELRTPCLTAYDQVPKQHSDNPSEEPQDCCRELPRLLALSRQRTCLVQDFTKC